MKTIELPRELQKAIDANGGSPHLIDPRTNTEYVLLRVSEIQEYLDFVDAMDPEQLAIRKTAARDAAKRLNEDV